MKQETKAAKYGLSFKPREVNIEIVKYLLAELQNLNLIHKEKSHIMLSDEGEKVALLIKSKKTELIKEAFTKLMLEICKNIVIKKR